jgi:IS5 family transposase
VNRRAKPHQPLNDYEKRVNRTLSHARARGEHPFRIVKQLWGFQKVRNRGLAKNLARAHIAFALANLYALRRKLMPPQAACRPDQSRKSLLHPRKRIRRGRESQLRGS